jgi:hypothetical protein
MAVFADLEGAGLFKQEAESLFSIWRAAFVEAPGITAFHVLPREEYDRMLKLNISPTPGRIVRVGIALYPRMEAEPELASQADDLIGKLGSETETERQAAAAALQSMGPVAWRQMEAAAKRASDPRVRERILAIVEAGVDASDYLSSP